MSKIYDTDFRKVKDFIDESFVQIPLKLLESDAWRNRPINCIRLMDRLIIEHIRQGGRENGNLIVTYNEFQKHGIPRKYIKGAIKNAEELKLIRVEYGCYYDAKRKYPNKYTLTFFKEKIFDEKLNVNCWRAPSNDWRKYTHHEGSPVYKRLPKPVVN